MQPEREVGREPAKIRKNDDNNMNRTDASKQRMTKDTKEDDGFGMSEETGVEAAAKKAPKKIVKPDPSGKEIKLTPGNSKAVID